MPDFGAPPVSTPAATIPWEASANSGTSGAYTTIATRTNERGVVRFIGNSAFSGNVRVTVDGQTPVVVPIPASSYVVAVGSVGAPTSTSPTSCEVPYNSSILIEAAASGASAFNCRVIGVHA
jgi:hypothetical protein